DPLTRRGAEDDEDRIADVVVVGGQRHGPRAIDIDRKSPPRSQEVTFGRHVRDAQYSEPIDPSMNLLQPDSGQAMRTRPRSPCSIWSAPLRQNGQTRPSGRPAATSSRTSCHTMRSSSSTTVRLPRDGNPL